ncbi:hypothetical protein V1477_006360 [Vespula maculifrons]|uniref:Uncharacterized protein n=1 Tax=Vespula maculifrons TaxID=7453 RepID=A0ABD2CK94_VESMC
MGSSRPLRTYFFRTDRNNRSRVITHLGEPNGGHWKGLVAPSKPIFFAYRSDQQEPSYNAIAPRRTGPGSFERARPALYAHIFCVQIGPIGADTYENRTSIIGKDSSRPLRPHFFRPDRTNRSRAITHLGESNGVTRRTGPELFERARRFLCAHIFYVQIGPIGADTYENRTLIIGKDSSRPLRPHFFRPDGTNRSRVITHLEEPDRGRLKELVASSTRIFFTYRSDQQEPSYNGLQGSKEKKNYSLTIFFLRNYSTYENRTLIIGKDTLRPLRPHFFEPSYNGLQGSKEKKNYSLTIFFLRNYSTYENRTLIIGKDSSRPLRPHFFRLDRTNRSRAITHPGEPDRGRLKELVASSTRIFFTYRSDKQEPSYNAPRRTERGSLERARRVLYGHIFYVQIGPIGADSYENQTLIIGKDTSRPLHPHFFRPDRTNRSRAITYLGEPDRGRLKELVASSTRIFFTYRSDQQEPSYNGLQGTKEKKNYSLTIFFLRNYSTYENRTLIIGNDTSRPLRPHFSPRRTERGSLERARRVLYAHIFYVQIGPIGADSYENQTLIIGKDTSRPLRPHFFRPHRTNRSRAIKENQTGVIGKGSSRPLRAYFFRPDGSNRCRVISHLGEPDRGRLKELVASSTRIFFMYRSDQQEPSYNGLQGTKEKKNYSLTIFFLRNYSTYENRTLINGKDTSGPLRPHFFRQDRTNRSRAITHLGEPNGGHWKGLVASSTHIFFTTYENRTLIIGKDTSLPLRPHFFRPDRTNRSRAITHLGEPNGGHWKGPVAPSKPIFFAIFFSETIAPRRTGPELFERARRVLCAHIFYVQIGPIGADTYENRTLITGKDSSRPLRPHFFRPDGTNRSGVITFKENKGKKHFSLTIFFSETIVTRRTGPELFERARRVLCAHIFYVQIGPIGADTYENRTLIIGKDSSRPLRPHFFRPDGTNTSRVITHLGEPDRGRLKELVASSTRIFFTYRSDQQEPSYNGLQGTKEKKNYSLTISFLRNCSTYENRTLINGKDTSGPLRPHFFRADRTNRSRAITHLGEPNGGHWKGLVASSTHIFFTTYENWILIIGKDTSRPLRPHFFRPDRTNRSRAITHLGEQDRGRLKEVDASSTLIFFTYRSDQYEPSYKGNKGKKHFSLTIFFSETIVPWRTGPGSFERARRVLCAHIFYHLGEPDLDHWKGLVAPSTPTFFSSRSDKSEPSYNTSRRTGPGSFERARRALYAHIFYVQIGPIGADSYENQTLIIGKDTSRPLRPHFFRPHRTNRSRAIKENQTGVIGKGSSRPLRAYFFRPDGSNRCRVISHLGEPDRGRLKELVASSTRIFFMYRSDQQEPSYNGLQGTKEKKNYSLTIFFLRNYSTYENRTLINGKDTSGPLRPHFFRQDRTNRSRAITHLGEPNGGHWKGLVASSTHIFFTTYENRTLIIGKDTSLPLRPHFFRPDRTNRSRAITHLGEPNGGHWKGPVAPSKPIFFAIFFSETIAPRRTGPELFERARRVLCAHIFYVQIGPIGADTYENRTLITGKDSSRPLRPHFFRPDGTNRSGVITFKENKGKKHFSLTIFFSETIVTRRTGPELFERARRVLCAHIFYVQIGPIGADTYENRTLIIGKDSSRPLRPHFFRPDGTNTSRVITHLGEPDRGRLKELVASSTRIFFTYRSDQQEPSYNGLQGTKEKKNYSLTISFLRNCSTYENRTLINGKDTSGPLRPHFFRADRTNRSRAITHLGEPNGGHWKGLVASSTHIFFTTYENWILIIGKDTSRPLRPHFFRPDRTNRSRAITHLGEPDQHLGEPDLDHWKGLVAPSTPTFFSSRSDKSEPSYNTSRRTGPGSFERARRALYAHIFDVQIGPIGAEIFFSETIAPRRTGPELFERARRVLCAHIFYVQIGPIGADTYENRTLITGKDLSRPLRPHFFLPRRTGPELFERARRVLCAHIFYVQIRPIGAERTGPGSFERARRAFYAHIFCVQIGPIGHLGEPNGGHWRGTYENRTRVTGKGPSRALSPYFLRTNRTNRNRVITENRTGVIGKGPSRPLSPYFLRTDQTNSNRVITNFFLRNYSTYENRTLIIGKDSSRPLRPHFFRPDGTNTSRVITHLGEPDRGRLKELVASSTRIFFTYRSDQQEPSYNGLQGTKEKKNYSLTIFFLRNCSTYENRTLINGKDTSGPLRPHFFRADRTNRSRAITFKENKGKKHFSLTIFFSETIVPWRTGPGSLERAHRVLYAHIFYVQIGPIGADSYENQTLIIGKDTSRPLRPHFFRPDRTNRSRAIKV